MKNYNLREIPTSGLSRKEIKNLLGYFKKYLFWLFLSFLAVVASSLTSVGIPYYLSEAIDKAILPHDRSLLQWYVLVIFFLAISSLILGAFQFAVIGRLSQKFLFQLTNTLFDKLQSLPRAFFLENPTGDLLSRFNNDTDKLVQFFNAGLSRLLTHFFNIVGILFFIFSLSLPLSLALLGVAFLTMIFSAALAKLSRMLSRLSLDSLASFSACVSENLTAFKAVVLFNKREDWVNQLSETNYKNACRNLLSTTAAGLFNSLYMILGNFSQVIILWLGVWLISQEHITLGVLVGFLTYSQRFYGSLGQLGAVWGEAQPALAAWERISLLLSLENNMPVIKESPADLQDSEKSSFLLEVKNVSFGYKENEMILKDLSLNFKKGSTYAVVGPTGGGKSTLAALLSRLVDPWEGEVLLEGRSLKTFEANETSQMIGVMLQDPYIFKGTLADNLSYANPYLERHSEETLKSMIHELGLSHILEALGNDLGLTLDNQSHSLSLGQKQLVSFMRAVLRRPKILILDEATANIDTLREKQLEEILKTLTHETTQIIIAHRLATIERADEVIFINRHYIRSGLSYHQALQLISQTQVKS